MTKAFQTNPAVQVALVGITAAGVGLTLTAASTALFAELHWTPGILAQAEDRLHRIGQRAKRVNIQYLISGQEGMDHDMWTTVGKKLDVLQNTLDRSSGDRSGASGGAAASAAAAGALSSAGAAVYGSGFGQTKLSGAFFQRPAAAVAAAATAPASTPAAAAAVPATGGDEFGDDAAWDDPAVWAMVDATVEQHVMMKHQHDVSAAAGGSSASGGRTSA